MIVPVALYPIVTMFAVLVTAAEQAETQRAITRSFVSGKLQARALAVVPAKCRDAFTPW